MGNKDLVKQGQFVGAVQQVLVPKGWDPLIPVTQATLESGWFDRVIGWNNFFGMKYPRSEKRRAMIDRPIVRVPTHEYISKAVADRKPAHLAAFVRQNIGELIDVRYEADKQRYRFHLYARFADWSRETKACLYWDSYMERMMPNAFACKQDPLGFVRGLFSGLYKYATCDPVKEYEEPFMKIYRQLEEEGTV